MSRFVSITDDNLLAVTFSPSFSSDVDFSQFGDIIAGVTHPFCPSSPSSPAPCTASAVFVRVFAESSDTSIVLSPDVFRGFSHWRRRHFCFHRLRGCCHLHVHRCPYWRRCRFLRYHQCRNLRCCRRCRRRRRRRCLRRCRSRRSRDLRWCRVRHRRRCRRHCIEFVGSWSRSRLPRHAPCQVTDRMPMLKPCHLQFPVFLFIHLNVCCFRWH